MYDNIINKLSKKKKLEKEEIEFFVNKYTNSELSDENMIKILKLICDNGLSFNEICDLTDVMLKSGEIIDLSRVNKTTVDKHSTGGIGDKVSLIVGPIVASVGLAMSKMSGRSLGYTGGTIDKLESIPGYNVSISDDEFVEILNEVGVSIISQTKNIAPADKKIYALRDISGTVESMALIASSIMSKKLASTTKIIVIDLKIGKGAFMKDINSGIKLGQILIKIAEKYDKKLVCILTDMNEPLGTAVGNALEVEEVIDFFESKRDFRLEKIVVAISSELINKGLNLNIEESKEKVYEVLNNGKAKNKFYDWIKSQNGNLKDFKIESKILSIKSPKSGYVKTIDALKIGNLSCELGAGRKKIEDKIDYNVGIKLNVHVGDYVNKDQILGEVYYNKEVKKIEEKFLDAFEITSKPISKDDIILKILK